MTHVDVTVMNPQDLTRNWVGRFLVDTGAPHETNARESVATGGGCFMWGRRGLGPEAQPVPSECEVPDTALGRFHTLVPRRHLEAIGIKPDDERTFEMADGTPVTLDIAIARLDFLGEYGADVVMFGEGDVEPLLGVTALESAGMVVDPRTQQLRRLPILPLKVSAFPELAEAAA